jgi:CRP-like cAMP-binding protein
MFGNRKKANRDPQAVERVAGELRGVSFFEGFNDDELHRVAELAEEVDADQGAVLIDQGRVGLECYVIVEGQAGVYVGDEHVATVGPGSVQGEMALVEHRPRSATVQALTPMKLISFDIPHFKTMLEEMPKAHDRVMEALAAHRLGPSQR